MKSVIFLGVLLLTSSQAFAFGSAPPAPAPAPSPSPSPSSSVGLCSVPSADVCGLFDILDDSSTGKLAEVTAYLKTHLIASDAVNTDFETSLIHSIKKQEFDVFHFLYDFYNHPDLNGKPDRGYTIYETALMYGDIDLIRFLKSAGGVLNDNGRTDLMIAAQSNTPSVVSALTQSGDINAVDADGQTALFYPLYNPQIVEVVKTLLQAGADVNHADQYGQTALIDAADIQGGMSETIKTLIAAGAKVNLATQDGSTALIIAAGWSNSDVVQELVQAGAQVNLANSYGTTALMYAANRNTVDVVKVLLQAGAQVNAKDFQNCTAVDYADGTAWKSWYDLYGNSNEDPADYRPDMSQSPNADPNVLQTLQKAGGLD